MAKDLRANGLHLPSFLPSRSEIKFNEKFDVRSDGIIADGRKLLIFLQFSCIYTGLNELFEGLRAFKWSEKTEKSFKIYFIDVLMKV